MALTQISTEGIKNGTITGSDLATNIDLVDNQKLRLGTGNDLQIYHDASGPISYIKNTTNGYLYIQDDVGQNIYIRATPNENAAVFKPNGAVELFYDNSKKFETTSAGATITGALTSKLMGRSTKDSLRDALLAGASGAAFDKFRGIDEAGEAASKTIVRGGSSQPPPSNPAIAKRMGVSTVPSEQSAKQIADKLDMKGSSSYVRVSQLKKQAIDKLKNVLNYSQVVDYL